MTLGFDSRREFSAEMHRRYLSGAMAAYWGVDADAITPIHGDSDGALAADKSGIDAIIASRGGAPVFVAERVRTLRQRHGKVKRPDFSLRVQTACGDDSELPKLMNAYQTGRSLPDCYLFGIAAADNTDDAVDRGLSALFWLDAEEIIASIDAGQLEGSEYSSPTGEITRYYAIDDLRDAGCVTSETRGLTLRSATDDEKPLREKFPAVEPRVETPQNARDGGRNA